MSLRAQDKLLSMDPREVTHEMVARKLAELVLSRGKKGVDRQDQVDMLAYLATVARGPAQKVNPPAQPCPGTLAPHDLMYSEPGLPRCPAVRLQREAPSAAGLLEAVSAPFAGSHAL